MKKLLLLITLFICLFKFAHSQAGALDPSFGNNGIVTTDIGARINYNFSVTQVLAYSDGSLYLITDRGIAKKFSNGSIDSTYGKNGFSDPFPFYVNRAALQSDGKIVIAGDASSSFTVARYNTNGSLDKTFNKNGIQTTNFGFEATQAKSLAIQSDGKIVVAGYSNPHFAVARYNTDGSPDTTFSNDGKEITNFETHYFGSKSVFIKSNGKIIIVGSNNNNITLIQFGPDGSLDTAYKNNENHPLEYGAETVAAAMQKNGKIVVLVKSSYSSYSWLYRYNNDGSADSTFGKDGKTIIDTYSSDLSDIAISGDDKIVIGGKVYLSDNNHSDFAIFRFNNNGSPDSTFSGDGKATTHFGGDYEVISSIAVQNDGKLVAVGQTAIANSTTITVAIAKYDTNGRLDNTFGVDGKLTDYFQQGSTTYNSSLVQKDGKLVVGGSTWNGQDFDFVLVRYDKNGSLDKTFNTVGYKIINFGSANDYVNSIAVQKDGKIVAAGSTGNGGNADFAISRVNPDGSIDSTFDGDGIKTTDFSDSTDVINSIAIQSDGKIAVAGSAVIKSDNYPFGYTTQIALARYKTNGSLDSSFSGDGLLNNFDGYTAKSAAIQKDGKIVIVGNGDFFTVVRYNTDGSLDSSFSDDGLAIEEFGEYDYANAAAIQKDGKIVSVGTVYTRGEADYESAFRVVRYNTNGNLDSTFNNYNSSLKSYDYSKSANSIALQADGKILVGGSINDHSVLLRFNADGSTDNSFGTNGIQITYVSNSNDRIQSIALDNDKLYAVGYGAFPGNFGIVARYLLTDNKAPAVTLSAPKNNATYLAPAAHIKLSAAAADNDGIITKVEFYNGTALLHTETVFPYGFVWKNVPLGNYTLTAKAFDNSGLVTTSAPIHIFVVPNKPPVVSITKPVNNRSFAAPGYIHLEAAASDTDGRVTNVKFYNGSSLLRTEYEYPYTYHWENVPVGTYTITAVATDNWGAHTTSAPVTIRVTSANAMIVSNKPSSENNKTALNDDLRLSLYPNPATNSVNIYTKGLQQNKQATISIISASGIVMKTMQTSSSTQTQLNVSTLAKGIYTIKIVSGGKTLYKQFMKL